MSKFHPQYIAENEKMKQALETLSTPQEVEDKLITIALAATGGRRKEAAALLGMNKVSFFNRITQRRMDES